MPALVEAEEIASPAIGIERAAHLKAYRFQPGHAPVGKVGRPKGMLNASTVLLKSAPRLAKSYVKEGVKGNATILTDARKWILPIDGDAPDSSHVAIVFLGTGQLPRPVLDVLTVSPSAPPDVV